jgi:peptide/nickel transport system permease protein
MPDLAGAMVFPRPRPSTARARFLRHRGACAGFLILVVFTVATIAAPYLGGRDPIEPSLRNRLRPPSAEFWLGTDALGRDLWSRMLYGARLSLPIGLLATGLAVLAGAPAGLAAGYYAGSAVGWVERLIMRVMDILLAFPAFLLALMLVSALGPGLVNAMLAVSIVGVPVYARIAHASALAVRQREFVAAAQASGASDATIIWRHLLPNSVQPLIVQGTLGVATAILAAAGLSFLGLGAQPPAPEWGAMLNDGRVNLETAPWTTMFPGLAILSTVVAINLVGDGLRDALDPRLRSDGT